MNWLYLISGLMLGCIIGWYVAEWIKKKIKEANKDHEI
jgi:uncharacterized membrane-anchored protein YhcB (DUF1043 family)